MGQLDACGDENSAAIVAQRSGQPKPGLNPLFGNASYIYRSRVIGCARNDARNR